MVALYAEIHHIGIVEEPEKLYYYATWWKYMCMLGTFKELLQSASVLRMNEVRTVTVSYTDTNMLLYYHCLPGIVHDFVGKAQLLVYVLHHLCVSTLTRCIIARPFQLPAHPFQMIQVHSLNTKLTTD